MKLKLPIRDELFAHAKTSSFWNESDFIEWDRGENNDYDFIFLTDISQKNSKNEFKFDVGMENKNSHLTIERHYF
jgi:hypothetical protein